MKTLMPKPLAFYSFVSMLACVVTIMFSGQTLAQGDSPVKQVKQNAEPQPGASVDTDSGQPNKTKAQSKQEKDRGSAEPSEDWPLFRGNRESTGVSGSKLPDSLKKLEVLWEYKVPDGGFEGSPIVVQNKLDNRKTVYIGDMDGEVISLDLETGKVNWKYDTGLGISASPAYHDGRIFIGDIDGIFWCFDEKGTVLWKHQCDGEISGSANFFKGNVLFGSQDSKLYAFNEKDGTKAWEVETPDQIQCSTTVANGKGFVAGCDAYLHLIDLEAGNEVAKVEIHSPTRSTPAVTNGLAVFGTEQSDFFAVNLASAEMEWSFAANQGNAAVRGSAAISKGNVVFGARNKRVYCVDLETGAPRWKQLLKGKIDASPVIVRDRVIIGSTDGRLYALALKDGTIEWQKQFRGGFLSSPAVAFERLIVATDRGVVYCLGSEEK